MNNKLCIILLSVTCIAESSQQTSKAASRTISNVSTPTTVPHIGFEKITPRPSNPVGRGLLFGISRQPEFPNTEVETARQWRLRNQNARNRNQEEREDQNTQATRARRHFPTRLPANQALNLRAARGREVFMATLPLAANPIRRPRTYLDAARGYTQSNQ